MNFRVVRWVNADLVNHIVQLITLQANRLCCQRLMGLEGYAVGLKKSLRHHPQGHNNTSSHAHDEVDTMLHLRCAAVVCLLLPNLSCLWGRCSSTESCLMLEIFNEKFPPIAKSAAIKTASAPQGFIRLSERHSVSFLGNPGVSHPRH